MLESIFQADLSGANTLGLRARADHLVRLTRPADVDALARLDPPLFILGGGSNVVLPERLPGTVAKVELAGIERVGEDADAIEIEAGAGESWHGLVAHCVEHGLGGLENLALIPGTVGAAPVQNIGAYGLEVGERIARVTAFDLHAGAWREWTGDECRFAYRDSVFKQSAPGRWLITRVRFRLPRRWVPRLDYPDLRTHPAWSQADPTPRAIFEAVCAIRQAKLPDPARLPNAGSFFKNPIVDAQTYARLAAVYPGAPAWPQPDGRVKLAAAWLIEQAGWKGRDLGPVGMHERHALVLVNRGGATAADVMTLAEAVRAAVAERFGVVLEAEPVSPSVAQGTLASGTPERPVLG